MAHWIPLTIVIAYVVALFAVTWWARRLTARGGGGLVGYLLAGRNLPPLVAAALLAGLAVGGVSTIGTAEWAYTKGISAGWYNAAWAAGAFAMAGLAARRYRRLEIATLPEFFETHYGVSARILGVLGQLVIQVVVTSLQYIAGGVILSSLMPELFDFRTGVAVTAAVFVCITLIGGLWAAGLTNVINVSVIYLGLILGAVLSVGKLGGIGKLAASLPEGHPGFDPLAMGLVLISAWFLVMITMSHSTQSVIQVGFATRDARAASQAYLIGGLMIAPVGFIGAVIGMAAAVSHPGILPTEALPRAVLDLSPLSAGIILAGLWAADVSTASALLMGSATLVVNDVVKRFFAPDLQVKREQAVCRWIVLGLSCMTFALALTVQGILKVLLDALSVSTAYTLVVLATLYCPRLCRRSTASWVLGVTMVALAGWLLIPPEWRFLPHPIFFTWPVSLLTFALTRLIDKRPIPDRQVAA